MLETAPALMTCRVCEEPREPGALDWARLAVAAVIASQSMIFGLAVNLEPPAEEERLIIHGVLGVSAILVFVLAGGPILRAAWNQLKARRFGLEQFFLLGMFGAFGASLVATFTGEGTAYYEVVSILVAIWTLGTLLTERQRGQALQAVEALRSKFETCEVLNAQGQIETRDVTQVKIGDRCQIAIGSGIPIDGVVESGSALVRETSLTGEPYPVVKREGDSVMAGSETVDASLVVRATRNGKERTLDRLLAKLSEMQLQPARWQREADRLVGWFLPLVLVLSVFGYGLGYHAGGWTVGLWRSMAVILVACPCALGLAVPVAIWSGLNALAQRGLVANQTDALEALASVDTVVFDKTGTLSEDELVLIDFVTVPGISRPEVQGWVSRVERESHHPMAKAFTAWASAEAETHVKVLPGIGLAGWLKLTDGNERHIEVGNPGLLRPEEWAMAETLRSMSKGETQTRQEIFVRVDGQLMGLARLRETLRETSRETVFTLQSAGYEVLVFTGDREAAAVQGLGCEVRAGMSAEDKARQIEALESSGKRVLFVGDGVNDAPALAAAQASIGLSQGAELAQSVAGFVGNGRDLQRIPEALELAARVKAGLRANLMFALFYNLIGMLMALLGYLNPVVAAILMLASSVTVTGRALRFAAQLTEGKAGQNRRRPATSELSLLSNPGAWCGLAFVLQAVGLIYLAQLQGVWMVAVALPFWFASVFTAWQWRQQRPGLSWQMSASMLSLGNLGMLLGWWADAKFRPVLRAGACLCGCAKSNLGQGLVAHWNWMHTGMAVASLGAMLLVREDGWGLRHWKGRLAHAIFSVIGMTLGMHGAAVLMGLLGILRPAQLHFFLSYGAMTTGMLLGMFASCALWRWVARTRLAAT